MTAITTAAKTAELTKINQAFNPFHFERVLAFLKNQQECTFSSSYLTTLDREGRASIGIFFSKMILCFTGAKKASKKAEKEEYYPNYIDEVLGYFEPSEVIGHLNSLKTSYIIDQDFLDLSNEWINTQLPYFDYLIGYFTEYLEYMEV